MGPSSNADLVAICYCQFDESPKLEGLLLVIWLVFSRGFLRDWPHSLVFCRLLVFPLGHFPLKPPPLGRLRGHFGASWGQNVAVGTA